MLSPISRCFNVSLYKLSFLRHITFSLFFICFLSSRLKSFQILMCLSKAAAGFLSLPQIPPPHSSFGPSSLICHLPVASFFFLIPSVLLSVLGRCSVASVAVAPSPWCVRTCPKGRVRWQLVSLQDGCFVRQSWFPSRGLAPWCQSARGLIRFSQPITEMQGCRTWSSCQSLEYSVSNFCKTWTELEPGII